MKKTKSSLYLSALKKQIFELVLVQFLHFKLEKVISSLTLELYMSHLRLTSLYQFTIICLLALTTSVFAECDLTSFQDSNQKRDFEAIQEFVNSKRTIPFAEKVKTLKFSGDIRLEYAMRKESQNGRKLRGKGVKNSSGLPVSENDLDFVFKFQFDYDGGDTWGQAKIEHDNLGGIEQSDQPCTPNNPGLFGSGFCDDFCLKRAFFGYRITKGKDWTFDVEIGRRPLNLIFESYIEFKNRFDGILFRYDKDIKPSSKFYVHAGPFIVDYRSDHYAIVGEIGYLNFLDKKIDIRYSYIDWDLAHRNRCGAIRPLGNKFRNSQFSTDINFPNGLYGKKAQIYGAFLVNSAAKAIPLTLYKKENIGWYAGFLMGEVRKKGDWAIDISYEYVQAYAIPDSDVSGIDRGNVLKETFFVNQRGKSNYKGWEYQYLYAISNSIQVNLIYDSSVPANAHIGGWHRFKKFECDIILKF